MFVQVGAGRPCTAPPPARYCWPISPEGELSRLLTTYPLVPSASRTIVDRDVLTGGARERCGGRATRRTTGEQEEGVSCIAGPVRDFTGQVVAAISISGPWIRITPERVPALVPLVLDGLQASCPWPSGTDGQVSAPGPWKFEF